MVVVNVRHAIEWPAIRQAENPKDAPVEKGIPFLVTVNRVKRCFGKLAFVVFFIRKTVIHGTSKTLPVVFKTGAFDQLGHPSDFVAKSTSDQQKRKVQLSIDLLLSNEHLVFRVCPDERSARRRLANLAPGWADGNDSVAEFWRVFETRS